MTRRPWDLKDFQITDRSIYSSRRDILKGLVAAGLLPSVAKGMPVANAPLPTSWDYTLPEVTLNPAYTLDRSITPETAAISYNNFYEFGTDKATVWRRVGAFKIKPWRVEVAGLCHKPQTFGMEDLLAIPQEERRYRFRCVEAWSMAVPWIGFPLAALLKKVEPMGDAKFVRLITKSSAAQMPGVKTQPWYKWPYYEGLTMAEAMNQLTILATGMYGHPLPKQNGAPVRLVVPWKYGYKNIKSIVRIELVASRPKTFWNDIAAKEYDFWGNVRPDIPHPRWSQASERRIPDGERVQTLMYNGYAEQVASLY